MTRLLLCALLLWPIGPPAQAARDAEEKSPATDEKPASEKQGKPRRKPAAKPSPAKVYGNEDLKKTSPGSEEASPAPEGSEGAAPYTAESSLRTPEPVEQDWRSRAREKKAAIDSAQSAVGTLEGETKRLGFEILMSSDTNAILELRAQQQELTEQLEAARRRVEEAKKAQDEFETEARRAGVPSAWILEP